MMCTPRPHTPYPVPSSINFPHHDVDAGIDCDDVREQVAFDHAGNGGEVDVGWRTDAPANRLGRAVGDEVVPLLSLGTLDCDVAFADGRTRSLHHLLEV